MTAEERKAIDPETERLVDAIAPPTPVLPCEYCGSTETKKDVYAKGRIICSDCDRDIKVATPPPSSVSREGELNRLDETTEEAAKKQPPTPTPLPLPTRDSVIQVEKVLRQVSRDVSNWRDALVKALTQSLLAIDYRERAEKAEGELAHEREVKLLAVRLKLQAQSQLEAAREALEKLLTTLRARSQEGGVSACCGSKLRDAVYPKGKLACSKCGRVVGDANSPGIAYHRPSPSPEKE